MHVRYSYSVAVWSFMAPIVEGRYGHGAARFYVAVEG
jgi:hypothetical protein